MIKQLVRNPVVAFTAGRHLRYAIQILRGILVAKFLGPYLFGIWGFITLAQQYLSTTSFGIQYALTVELSTKFDLSLEKQERILQSGITITLFLTISLVLLALGISALPEPLFSTYSLENYVLLLAIFVGLTHLEQVFINIYRVFGKLGRIAITEIISASLPLAAVFIYPKEQLISALLGAMITAGILNIGIYLYKAPFRIRLSLTRDAVVRLIRTGIPLLIYNLSVYLIPMAARTLVSIYYSVETLGYFTLAESLSRSVFFGLEAIAWAFLPMIYSRVRAGQGDALVGQVVQKVTQLYATAIFLVVLLASVGVPLIFLFLEAYRPAQPVVQILLIGGALNALPLAYSSLAIARDRQLTMAWLNSIAVSVVILLGWVSGYTGSDFIWVAVAALLGHAIAMILVARFGSYLLGMPMRIFWRFLPMSVIFSLLLTLIGTVVARPILLSTVALVFFVITNRTSLFNMWNFAKTFIIEKRQLNVLG